MELLDLAKEVGGTVGVIAVIGGIGLKLLDMMFKRYKPSDQVSAEQIESLQKILKFSQQRGDIQDQRITALEKGLREARVQEYNMLKILMRHVGMNPSCAESLKKDLADIGIMA